MNSSIYCSDEKLETFTFGVSEKLDIRWEHFVGACIIVSGSFLLLKDRDETLQKSWKYTSDGNRV